MLRPYSIGKDIAHLMLYSGGGRSIFDLKIEGGNHQVSFENNDGHPSPLAEVLDRERPIKLIVGNKGFSGPLSSGSFTMSFIRVDHKHETVELEWQAKSGLGSE